MAEPLNSNIPGSNNKLGTFGGVFTPSILTILGIILFLRMGYVVGRAGLGQALLIVGAAHGISILTAISLAAIATNLKAKGGGDYYLISRTLGVEFGGAIGVVLFLAQSISIAFYSLGFGEAVAGLFAWGGPILPRIIAVAAVVFLFSFAWKGADWATRLQFVIMAVLILALLSFFTGGWMKWNPDTLVRNWKVPEPRAGFWTLFAIFFPAVTGFTQGVSMSGDLKDPGRSLAKGTFWAVGVSIVIYLAAAIVFAGTLHASDLAADYTAMGRIAVVGSLIVAGVIAATLSSAMASFLGAPRILQAMAKDHVLPFLRPFAQGSGPSDNPRRGVLLAGGIAMVAVALGDLNAIAPVVAMCFLVSYGLLNYATYFEGRAASPSFRPRLRWYHRHMSLLGALACLGAMLAVNLPAGMISVSLLFGLHQYLKRTVGPPRWAHGRRSYDFQRVRELLFDMSGQVPHQRDWRPYILAFANEQDRQEQLLRFASWIEGGSGLTTLVSVVEDPGPMGAMKKQREYGAMHTLIREAEILAFPLVVTAPDFSAAMDLLLQAHGIGPLRANLVLLNWIEQRPSPQASAQQAYGRMLQDAIRLGCNIVVFDASPEDWQALLAWPEEKRRIDLWWEGGPTSNLMLLCAYLMTRVESWHSATIRILAQGKKGKPEATLRDLQGMLEQVRIEATIEIVGNPDVETLVRHSHDAALVFIPMEVHANQPTNYLGETFDKLIDRIPAVALFHAAQDIQLTAEPEEGRAGELAAAVDIAAEAEKKALKKERAASKAAARSKGSTAETVAHRARAEANAAADKAKALEEEPPDTPQAKGSGQ